MSSTRPIIMLIAIRQGHFSREVLRGVIEACQESDDWEVWAVPPINDQRHLEACLESRNVIGAITRGLSVEVMGVLEKRDIPAVSIRGLETASDPLVKNLHVDDEAIGSVAGGEFMHLNLGYWGFVHWQDVAWSEERRKSFQTYATIKGAQNSTVSLSSDERHNWDGVLKISRWLETLSKPCGILACNDEAGIDVLHACQLAGLSVPDQVAVIGVDNDRLLCESTVPPLSSIDLHAADVGIAAVRQLRSMLGDGEDPDYTPKFSRATMVVRESSHAIDRYLLIYQKALDVISANELAGISVSDMAAACGVSRRGLERAFQKHASESPAEYVRRQRLAAILILLKNKSLSLEKLGQQSGFSDAAGLSNFIKRMTGQAPGAFRQQNADR